MPSIIDLVRDVRTREHTLQGRRAVREAWTVGGQRRLGDMAWSHALVRDDGSGGWELSDHGAVVAAAEGDLLTTRQAAALAGYGEDRVRFRALVSDARRRHGVELQAPREQWPDERSPRYDRQALEAYLAGRRR